MTTTSYFMPLNRFEAKSIRHLWTHTILGTHPQTKDAYNWDTDEFNTDALEDTTWRWSSGEKVLIEAVLCMLRCSGPFNLNHIDNLDTPTRKALIEAFSFRYCR